VAPQWGTGLHSEVSKGLWNVPEISDEVAPALNDLEVGTDLFENYAGIDDDTFASDEIQKHIDAGHLMAADSLEELALKVGGDPILNKDWDHHQGTRGSREAETYFETKLSNVKSASRKCQRVILPRLLDAVLRTLALMSSIGPSRAIGGLGSHCRQVDLGRAWLTGVALYGTKQMNHLWAPGRAVAL
jgi:hypothetical protein